MSFLHTLNKQERDTLRKVVKMVHFQYYPDDHKSDYEADKLIASLGPEVVATLIKTGRDHNIDNI